MWAIQRFSSYIGAQKVINETCHQPFTFLNSQRIRDGVVIHARIATWLKTLQGRDVKARYAQNYKSSLGNGLAACQNCSTDMLYTSAEPKERPQPQIKSSQVKSSWALLSFRYMCGHIAGRDVVSHRTTVLHKYRYTTRSKNSINLYTTDLLSALTIHMLYIKVVTYT